VKRNLHNASQSFICKCCKVDRPITNGLNTDLHLDVGNGVSLEKVNKFCYLEDMLDGDGGCDSASAWKMFLTHSNCKRILVKTERQGICYLCEELSGDGSETWPMKVEDELKTNRTEMSTIR